MPANHAGNPSPLESVAVEGAPQLGGAGEVAAMETEGRREHSLLQVEIKMGREESEQREGGGVVHFAHDPFAALEKVRRKRTENVVLGAFAVDLDEIDIRQTE